MGRWKRAKEYRKYGISFSIAARVFADSNRIEFYDEAHSTEEDRYIMIGQVGGASVVVMVVYTECREAIRIISARLAAPKEKEAYYNDGKTKH